MSLDISVCSHVHDICVTVLVVVSVFKTVKFLPLNALKHQDQLIVLDVDISSFSYVFLSAIHSMCKSL